MVKHKVLTLSDAVSGRKKERLYTLVAESEQEADVLMVNADRESGLTHGLTAFTAALFIVGVLLTILLGILSGVCIIVLSRSWLILRRDFREYQEHVREMITLQP